MMSYVCRSETKEAVQNNVLTGLLMVINVETWDFIGVINKEVTR